MSVAGQSDGLERHEGSLNTCLIEPLGYAMGVGAMIARLSGNVEHRYSLEVNQLVRRLLLNPTRNQIRPIRFFLANGLQFRGVFDRRIVMNEGVRQTPHSARTRGPALRVFNERGNTCS